MAEVQPVCSLEARESLAKPSIQASNTTVSEMTGPVVFTCLSKHNGISISWFHEGERLRLTGRMKLSQDNSSLTMNPVRMEDAGKYQCEVSNPGSAIRSDSLILSRSVSLLLPWSLPTTAQLILRSVPRAAAEGQDVLLRNPSRAEALIYTWYKADSLVNKKQIGRYAVLSGTVTEGPAHTGREKIYPNGALLLQNVTLADTGSYSLEIIKTIGEPETLTAEIHVFRKLPKTSSKSSSSDPVEDQGSVTLLCEPETQNTTAQCLIHNQSLPDNSRLELSMGNRTLTGHTVTRNESGLYECRTRTPVSSSHSDSFFLNVLCEYLLFPQSLTKPSIQASNTTVSEMTGPVVFTCLTKHNGISISWFHEGERLRLTERMKLSQDNSSLTMNPVRMEDAGKYQCEVSNPGSAIRSDSLILSRSGDRSEGRQVLSAGAITGIVIASLLGVFLVAALAYFLFLTKTRDNQSDPGHQQPPASTSGEYLFSLLNWEPQHPLYANQAAVPIYAQTVAHVTASVVTRLRSQKENLAE
ncbi:cell adhesion molecule CEACAM6-like [Tenrec ecaudatus]|uniref:cell adhesion molecule CEACAM6-like n=1 Tax=Tenrec ecaudatus TaxID=94439 RepID=UPI003F59047A